MPFAPNSFEEPVPDVIAAISTAAGQGAVCVVRLSGPGADRTLGRFFVTAEPMFRHPRKMVLGRVIDPATGAMIDQALAVFFPGPDSFTGEDSAEIHGHGGAVIPRLILEAALAAGARQAEPGEFTQRAFLGGKLSLDQAEAVADLVASQSEAEAALAARHLCGAIAKRIKPLAHRILGLQAELMAVVDFEEEWDRKKREFFAAELGSIAEEISALADIRKTSRIFREGLRLVLAGPPNAGKSSLFNAILGRDRALVSPRPGTTRDFLEAAVSWNGLRVELVDTAGLGGASVDELEKRGQDLALREIREADMILWLRPLAGPGSDKAPPEGETGAPMLTVRSKADLAPEGRDGSEGTETDQKPPAAFVAPEIRVSAKTGEGLAGLMEAVLEKFGAAKGALPEIVPNRRQQTALEDCRKALSSALDALSAGHPPDIIALDLNMAMEKLGCVIGRVLPDDVLEEVFGNFCVGK